jgi:Ser/Thr protein kinase RdoA (MazF antagonist)
MPYTVDIQTAIAMFPEYTFVCPLTPSEQKAAFHVKTATGADLCLKLIAPHYERDRLDREIQALQSIDNPNVVKLVEYTFSWLERNGRSKRLRNSSQAFAMA